MDFNQKSRGQKHHKNKARYKSKHKVQKKVSETAPERKLSFNPADLTSSEEEEELEDEQVDLNDFSLLAQAPISIGGHFQFKSDKNAETDCDFQNLQTNNLFSLDLNILQYSLNCIPFVERCGIDQSCFTENEIENMNARAHSNKVQYDNYLKTLAILSDSVGKSHTGTESSPLEALKKVDEQDKLDNKTPQSFSTDLHNQKSASVDKAELEDWLNDILGN